MAFLVGSGVRGRPSSTCGSRGPTAADATAFLATVNDEMLRLGVASQQAGWVYSTYITPDTEALNARASEAYIDAVARYAKEAARFDGVQLPADQRRQLDLLKLSLELVTPSDPKLAEEVTTLASVARRRRTAAASGARERGQAGACLDIEQITEVMATSRDPKRLREGLGRVAHDFRADAAATTSASSSWPTPARRSSGFADTGAMWRLKYDMPAEDFTKEVDRLWEQVRPLYVSLHAYVRMKLHEKYGDVVPATGPIPGAPARQHLGAGLVERARLCVSRRRRARVLDLTDILKRRRVSPAEMVKIGERFYTSLGFAPMPDTFWERSLFVKPADRDVVCHASAWDIDTLDDLRIKMCIDPTDEDFATIHHELGHNFYQRAYKAQPISSATRPIRRSTKPSATRSRCRSHPSTW